MHKMNCICPKILKIEEKKKGGTSTHKQLFTNHMKIVTIIIQILVNCESSNGKN